MEDEDALTVFGVRTECAGFRHTIYLGHIEQKTHLGVPIGIRVKGHQKRVKELKII